MESTLNLLITEIANMENEDLKIEAINEIQKQLHDSSAMQREPVACFLWVTNDNLKWNF
jgi:hypothetical protein